MHLMPLYSRLFRLKEKSGEEIPHVMRLCVEYLEANGLDTVGIFRRAPSNYTMQQIKLSLNTGAASLCVCIVRKEIHV